jgi:hypothetical protein
VGVDRRNGVHIMMDARIGKIRGDSRRLGNMAIQLASWRTVVGRHDSSGRHHARE